MWVQTKYALDFLYEHAIPFWDMSNANHLLVDANTGLPYGTNLGKEYKYWCLATNTNNSTDTTLIVYLKWGGTVDLDLSVLGSGACSGDYEIEWFDPRSGGSLQQGTVMNISASSSMPVSIGKAPNKRSKDWIALLRCIP